MDSAKAGRSPLRTTGLASRPAPRGGLRPVAAVAAVSVVVVASFTPPGRAAIAGSFAFLEFFTGVFSLVGLSITVMIGLAATDRLLLLIRHRILLQVVHRATAATAMVCLAIHVVTKLVEGHAHLWDPAIPFLASHRPIQVGLGTLASYLMIVATWTGVTRASYAQSRQPGRWRVLHSSAYAAWLLALVHGLGAGRSAKTWVLVSYAVCVALVVLALLVRLFVALSRRTNLAKAQTIRRMRPAGRTAPAAAAAPLATNVLIPSLDGAEWTDVEPSGPTRTPALAAPAGPPPAATAATAAPAGPPPAAPAEPPPARPAQPARPAGPPPQGSRAGGYRPYRPLREDRPVSPPHASPAPRHSAEPAHDEPPARPEPQRHPEPPTRHQPPARREPPAPARQEPPAQPPTRREPPAQPTARQEPAPPTVARQLDETAEITDEEFWAYIRNEVGR